MVIFTVQIFLYHPLSVHHAKARISFQISGEVPLTTSFSLFIWSESGVTCGINIYPMDNMNVARPQILTTILPPVKKNSFSRQLLHLLNIDILKRFREIEYKF